ncbi:MAG: enoyl-CoA hydratase/isomerase family protein [Alphaproteobacteria bacterium]|nr:enoyl-CoA hydratase/isomerase family protein [Alphaproteobacteria bacterium]
MIDTGSPNIQLSVNGAISVITLVRPEKLNALTFEMILALEHAAHLVDANTDVKVAIITGAGERAFCAGGDVNEWSKVQPEDFGLQWVRVGHRAFDALTRLRQPLIAALNGHALGGGVELAACADLRVGEEQIKVALPETGLGIIPGWSGTQRCVQRFGSQVVRRMALLGEALTADQALAAGVIDRITPQGESLAVAKEMAAQICARSAFATSATKIMINAADGEDGPRALEALGGIGAARSEELRKGLAAFKAKGKK